MPTVVVPFRDENAKRRLEPVPEEARRTVAQAMLDDVLEACSAVAREVVVAREGPPGRGGRSCSARRRARAHPRRQRRSAVRAGARPVHPARRASRGRARARRGRGRDDQRAGARGGAPVRAALRPRQRRPVHRARRAAGGPGGDGGHPEPRRRCGHAGRPGAARRPPGPHTSAVLEELRAGLTR